MAPQMSSPCSDPFYNDQAKSRLSCVPHSMRGSPVLPCAVVAGCWVQDWVFPIFNRRLRIKTLPLPSRPVVVPENEDEQIALRSWRARYTSALPVLQRVMSSAHGAPTEWIIDALLMLRCARDTPSLAVRTGFSGFPVPVCLRGLPGSRNRSLRLPAARGVRTGGCSRGDSRATAVGRFSGAPQSHCR
jgi:hypothetical protein